MKIYIVMERWVDIEMKVSGSDMIMCFKSRKKAQNEIERRNREKDYVYQDEYHDEFWIKEMEVSK